MKQFRKYLKEYYIALRVMSLSLALAATTFGIIAAYRQGYITSENAFYNSLLIIMITIAGIASQAGANLVNDYFEGSFKYENHSAHTLDFLGKERSYFDVFVFLSGIAALGLAGIIGLYLVYITDYKMLVIGVIGLIGSYAYTGEPFVYKRKGLGVPLSFILMGPLMLLGAYYPFAKQLDWYPILLGLPVSMFVPAMMLSNEMRDYKRDKRLVMGTLSVKLGSRFSLIIYDFLLFGAFILTGFYIYVGLYPMQAALAFILVPKAVIAHKSVKNFHRLSIPNTNKIHLYYFIIVSIVLLIWS